MLGTSCFKADKFTELFEESKQRMERKNILLVSKDCTFQPNTNLEKNRKAWSKAKIREASREKQAALKRGNMPRTEDTLEKARSASAAAKPAQVSKPRPKSRAAANDENVDPSTGQKLFRPKTGRSPHQRSIKSGVQLGQQLYEGHKVKIEKIQHRAKLEEEKRSAMRKAPKASQKTDQLVHSQKQQAF